MQLEIDNSPPDDWDSQLSRLPGATFCHLGGWAEAMTGVLGHRYHLIVARDDSGNVVGGLPLVRMKSLPFGHTLISMPFLNYGGPVGAEEVRTELADRARTFARDTRADRLVLRSTLADGAGLDTGREKVAVRLDLGDDIEEFWTDGLPSKVRSQVRRPRKEGMECALGPDQIPAFYRVFSENMRDLGTPVHGKGLFDALARLFPDQVVVGAVYHEGDPVAGGFGFFWEGELEMTWASSLRRFNRMAPNMMLYWNFMEETVRRGGRFFNFGRSTPGTGTHRFKKQWGGDDVPLHWTEWRRDGASGDPGQESGGLVDRATSLWSRLPLPVANRLGPLVSRHIPTF